MSMRIYFKSTIVLSLFLFATLFQSITSAQQYSIGKNGMVVSASQIASEVGIEILKMGGNSVDAAVGVGFALAVTYPAAGNIGGGGFMVIRLSDGTTTTIDYREKAPLAANENMFLDSLGNYDPILSQLTVNSAGVPGSVAGLLYAHNKYGKLPLPSVIQPAIDLARYGFTLSYDIAKSFSYNLDIFLKQKSSLKIFTKDSLPFQEGDIFIQKELSHTLELIRDLGKDGFYKGETADKIVKFIQSAGGIMDYQDLELYEPIERKALESEFHEFKVITMGPPSAGGISLIQMLNVLENKEFSMDDWNSSEYIHYLVETMKQVFADRSKHLGDSDFYDVPINELIFKDYAKEIFDKIRNEATPSLEITPKEFSQFFESEETTHYSVIDVFGNAVSTTTTLNSSFGSGIVVEGAGFLLNNEMDDFSSKPGVPNQFGLVGGDANKIEPGKRMLSSMTPTIVLQNEKPVLILGSPGGSTIPTVVLQVLLNSLYFKMSLKQAVDVPRFHHQWLPDEIFYEEFGLSKDTRENIEKRGHILGQSRVLGRIEAIFINNNNNLFFGATDPRGYGGAVGY